MRAALTACASRTTGAGTPTSTTPPTGRTKPRSLPRFVPLSSFATRRAPAGSPTQAGGAVSDGTVTTVHGGVYGTAAGKPAAVTGGKLTALPDGTLIPFGSGGGAPDGHQSRTSPRPHPRVT